MIIRACFVLPVYDPGPALARTVASLLPFGLPLYLTDDGSGPQTVAELDRMAEAEPLLRRSRLPDNLGKGAAVMEGLRRAYRDGFTHALQVDADGQHDVAAVAPFLALAQANPLAIISGVPQYDGTVPLARKYCRRFSHLWVWIGTLSTDIQDSLCGFRIYPLASTIRLMDQGPIRHRMAFDTEIIMRLHQEGVPVVNAPVNVTYPPDGVSHFRPWRDTLALIWMQAGMTLSAPLIVLRGRREGTPAWYRIRERGTALGFRMLLGIYRALGPRAVRALSEVVAFYYFLTSPRARQASRDYLTRLHAHCGPLPDLPEQPRTRDTYRHFRAFTRSIVDKFLAWSGHREDLDVAFPEYESFLALHRSRRGAIFLSAHLGNLDMMRALGVAAGLEGLNALVYSENAVRFHEMLRKVNPAFALNLIQISQVSPDLAITLQEKVDRGEFIFIVADRTPPGGKDRTVQAPFLGAEAPFPMGPFLLARLLRCPVHTMFCCREGQRYRVRTEPFAERLDWARGERDQALAQWAGRYAQAVEARCRETPFEWFNFFDFWCSHPTES
jgi:predicted LPLAT superfamily acyltransferase